MGNNDLNGGIMFLMIFVAGLVFSIVVSTVIFEINLFIKELHNAKFNLVYLLITGIPLLFLFYFSNYKFHNKLFRKREDTKEKEIEVDKQTEYIKELLDEDFYNSSEELKKMINKVGELEHEIDWDLYNSYKTEISNWLKEADKELETKKRQEEISEYRQEKSDLKYEIANLDMEKKKRISEDREKAEEIIEELDVDNTKVFIRDKLNEKEIKVLTNEGYEHANEFDVCKQKILTVLVKRILNHSKTHTFLVWSVRELLNGIYDIYDIREHETRDADLTFIYNGKKYALEIETGNLLRKKKQMIEKVRFLNRKYKKRWMFVVSNNNLIPAYRKLGLTTQRSKVAENMQKLLKIAT